MIELNTPRLPSPTASHQQSSNNADMLSQFEILPVLPAMAAYAKTLLARIEQATNVPFREVELQDWKPAANDCHRNVNYWTCRRNKDYQVFGWLVIDNRSFGRGVRFVMHSVVEDEHGTLYDITPIEANGKYSFLRADINVNLYFDYESNLYLAYGRSQFDAI